jgi:hypothetical protein
MPPAIVNYAWDKRELSGIASDATQKTKSL